MRERIVEIAHAEVGNPGLYLSTGTYWCGAFCVWVLRNAGLHIDVPLRTDMMGTDLCATLPITDNPLPGDIARFNTPSNVYGRHFAIVVEEQDVKKTFNSKLLKHIQKDSMFKKLISIDGGHGGDVVTYNTRDITKSDQVVYFSIEDLINKSI